MDKQLIEEKLESLRRCIKRIEQKRPEKPEGFTNNPDIQDIISLNLSRAVQICVDIAAHSISQTDTLPPDTMGKTFDAMATSKFIDTALAERMKKAVGFRNIAVHNYQAIDWQIVYNICHKNLNDFKAFATVVTHLIT